MWRRRWWGVALVLALALAVQSAKACPTVCQCVGTARVSVYCDFRGLESVPANLPLETTHLYFMGNKFTRVVLEMLQGNAQNADGTFSKTKSALAKLNVIYLPFDVKIQRQTFAEMKTDKLTLDGFTRVVAHPLEDPHFVAFSAY